MIEGSEAPTAEENENIPAAAAAAPSTHENEHVVVDDLLMDMGSTSTNAAAEAATAATTKTTTVGVNDLLDFGDASVLPNAVVMNNGDDASSYSPPKTHHHQHHHHHQQQQQHAATSFDLLGGDTDLLLSAAAVAVPEQSNEAVSVETSNELVEETDDTNNEGKLLGGDSAEQNAAAAAATDDSGPGHVNNNVTTTSATDAIQAGAVPLLLVDPLTEQDATAADAQVNDNIGHDSIEQPVEEKDLLQNNEMNLDTKETNGETDNTSTLRNDAVVATDGQEEQNEKEPENANTELMKSSAASLNEIRLADSNMLDGDVSNDDDEKAIVETTQQQADTSAAATTPLVNDENVKKVESLELELGEAHALIESLQQQIQQQQQLASSNNDDGDDVLQALQSNLQRQMSLKAEAENKVRLAERRIRELEELNQSQADDIQQFYDLQENLQQQMNAKAEAENKARLALERVQQLESKRDQQTEKMKKYNEMESNWQNQLSSKAETENNARLALERVEELEETNQKQSEEIVNLQKQLCEARELSQAQEKELEKVREERDEQHRKEMALTSRLNAAKMKEADKANLAEQYEDEIKGLEQELDEVRKELNEVKSDKQRLHKEFDDLKKSSDERVSAAERTLTEERNLNEERKRKMKAFVESKAEELRQVKSENESLQVEASQTSRSLMELNNRWKQLHAQYVQSQTRNRELQREMNRFKKDSENLHKVGDSLEMKLSRSATETEEHKNKRMAAKHELMTVLRTLEVEREITAKLRDTIKFTFTPKALSQQRLLQEGLQDFESQLQKLSLRLGKPLPPSTVEPPIIDAFETSDHSEDGIVDDKAARSDADISRLIDKLERETQAVSQSIMALTGNIERMHMVLNASGERTCYTVLSELLMSGGTASTSPAIQAHGEEESEQGTRRRRMVPSVAARHRYGSVPAADMH